MHQVYCLKCDKTMNFKAVTKTEKEGVDLLIDFLVDNYYLVDWTLIDVEKSKKENYFFIAAESTSGERKVLKDFLKRKCKNFTALHAVCVEKTFDDYYGQSWSIYLEKSD